MNNTEEIISEITRKIEEFRTEPALVNIGKVIEAGDGVAKISGLSQAGINELLEFGNKTAAVVFNLEEDKVGAIILGDFLPVKEGDEVRATGRVLSVPVGNSLIGRVINPLGQSLDGKGELTGIETYYPIEKIAPGVTLRASVNTPLQTGIKAIDTMIPIGRGQRELIIGDRGTGKTALTIDAIINQKEANKNGKPVVCIYVAIGQKTSRVASIISQLEKFQAMDYTIVVAANAADTASLQYLAPYAGTSIGEFFKDQGLDVLIIYDDLTKHAWAYRQISLILRRPTGREAYPGDIFYLHSRLLERACRMSEKEGGGSLTALPVIETLAQDVSAYIPTNVISITDGQIYLEPDLFYAGIRPAINVGLSVSRVGGAAQIKAMKQVAGKLRLEMASYRELAAFSQFASELDPLTRKQIERGNRMVEILKQPQHRPLPVEEEIMIVWAATNGFLDDVEVGKVKNFEEEFLKFLRTFKKSLLRKIKEEARLDGKIIEEITEAVTEFKKTYG